MPLFATIANTLWHGLNLPAYRRFGKTLEEPRVAQQDKLRKLLRCNSGTAFGKAHRFERISSYEDFKERVPLADYDSLEPWIARIRDGESNVLTNEPVTHLVPTSGSAGARKLIPFTAGLQREFNAAIGPWLADLRHHSPGLLSGPAYWSVTPALSNGPAEKSAVPIGFDSDTAYLNAACRRLAEAVMAVPPGVQQAKSLEQFRNRTLIHLLHCRELRLISVWHPSFLALLLDSLVENWDSLRAELAGGSESLPADPRRAAELGWAIPGQPETIWPELRVISCWGEGAAESGAAELQRRFPHVFLQPKGLLATEAVVTLPFRGGYPLAINSHFFEFIDDTGRVFPAQALREGCHYEIVVTTAGGLWRYCLGDRVKVDGWLAQTPSLKFMGRRGKVSDCCGEKLAEPFVAEVLGTVLGSARPRFAMLAPEKNKAGYRYTLYVEGQAVPEWTETLDRELRRNPHYNYCREIGQLSPVGLFEITQGGFETFAQREASQGARLGDIKPTALSGKFDWSCIFKGKEWEEQETAFENLSLPSATKEKARAQFPGGESLKSGPRKG